MTVFIAKYFYLLGLPSHGYRLMNEIEEVSQGRVKMGPGTLYGVLNRMQKDGLICLTEDNGRRKVYRITSDGTEALQIEYERIKAMVRDSFPLEGGVQNGQSYS